jgi:hypothetical protein
MVSNDAEKGKRPKGKRFIEIGVSLFISSLQLTYWMASDGQ